MIAQNLKKIFAQLKPEIKLVAASKTRTTEEIEQAIAAGVTSIGENYVQEALKKYEVIGSRVNWHLIGHLQKNKAKIAVKIFDIIETVDSIALAAVLDKESAKLSKVIDILIEVNSAKEPAKRGVLPQNVEELVRELGVFKNLRLRGLMTMGPLSQDMQAIRPYFRKTKELFESIKTSQPSRDWNLLSMGMSDSYEIAIVEGANMVRIGTAIFGPR